MLRSLRKISGETCPRGDAGRSQSLRSTVRLKSRPWRNGWETGVNAGGTLWGLNSVEAVGEARNRKAASGIRKTFVRAPEGGRKVEAGRMERTKA
jgi:hypothetical protein